MEKSLNSSSDSGVSDNSSKAAFNKPTDFYQAFEVSMEDSVRIHHFTNSPKSDSVLDTTSFGANKALMFKKSRKSFQQSFNVSSAESLVNNESEQSVTFAKPQELFVKQNKSLVDFINVSFNETNVTATGEVRTNKAPEKDITTGNTEMNDTTNVTIFEIKTDPFKKKKSVNECTMMSLTEQRNNISTESFGLLSEPNQITNKSHDRSTSKITNNTSYLEESLINDDNLNNWMSDQSDELLSKTPFDSPKKNESLKKKAKVNNENSTCGNDNFEVRYKPPKLLRPASFVSKQLYTFIKKKLEPKYGIDTVVKSENLVLLICDTVKKVTRRKTYQKRLIQNLKKELARTGLIETSMDLYEFIIKFLPYSFRVKVVPCLQPVTNVVYPPKDIANPFDKIL